MATGSYKVNIPSGPFNGPDGQPTLPWMLWLLSPNFQSLSTGSPINPSNGGTGSGTAPTVDQVLVGQADGTYAPSTSLPVAATPAYIGDVTSAAGTAVNVLATVNAAPGVVGDGTHSVALTINGKGLTTASVSAAITGSPGSFTAVGAFGCNTKSAQTAAASGGAVAATGATNVVPYGYTTAAQADGIVTLLNNIRAALVANGIMS